MVEIIHDCFIVTEVAEVMGEYVGKSWCWHERS